MNIFRNIARMAFKDYWHEWQNSACLIISLATVLGPVLVLFGLKYGIVGSMINDLVKEPRNREISPISSGRFDAAWFKALAERDDIEFFVPRTRRIATGIELKSENADRILDVQLIPTAPGDPLLPNLAVAADSYNTLLLSAAAAKKLMVKEGDKVDGSIARRYQGKTERIHLELTVQKIVPATLFNQDGAFCSLALLEALENYRDGLAVPDLGWHGDEQREARYYPGFRLFAKTIYDVANLRDWFLEKGIVVKTRAHEIGVVERLNQNLSILYWAVAFTGLAGCTLSLSANLWSNVDRKRKELSVLRLVGFNSIDIVCFPIVQGILTAMVGWILAIGIYHLTALGIAEFMSERLKTGQEVCRMLPWHYVVSFLITCVTVMLVAASAGFKAANVETADGLREQ